MILFPSYCIAFPMPDYALIVRFFWTQIDKIADSDLSSCFLNYLACNEFFP